MENKEQICQSCGMPITADKQKGTNADGSLSNEYCSYCYKKGEFTNTITLDEQVEMGLNYYPPYKKAQTQEEKDAIKNKQRIFYRPLIGGKLKLIWKLKLRIRTYPLLRSSFAFFIAASVRVCPLSILATAVTRSASDSCLMRVAVPDGVSSL